MLILCGLLWGIITLIVLIQVIKKYLPELEKRIHKETEDSLTEKTENEILKDENTIVLADDKTATLKEYLPVLCIFVCLACLCGYRVAETVGSVISNFKMLCGLCVLCVACITDFKYLIIPNKLVLVLFCGRIISIVLELFFVPDMIAARLISSVIGAFTCLIVLSLVSKLTNGGLGAGDTKILCGIGFLCGIYAVVYTLVFACVACGIAAIFLLITKRKGMKDIMPMAPFILVGYIITIFMAVY